MLKRGKRWSVTDILTMFNISRTTFYKVLRAKKIRKQLQNGSHYKKVNNRLIFDDRAVLIFAGVFTHRSKQSRVKYTKNRTANKPKKILKDIDNKLNILINRAGGFYN